MTTNGRTEATTRAHFQEGTPMNPNVTTARRRTVTSLQATAMTNIARTAAALTTLLVLASHAFANDPSDEASTDPYGTAAATQPVTVRVEIVVYPFAALQDSSAAGGAAPVDPYGWATLGSSGAPSFEDVPYPLAGQVSRTKEGAPVQVDPYGAATSVQAQAPRVAIVVYPFGTLQDVAVRDGTHVDPYGWATVGSSVVPPVEDLPYPLAGLVSRSSEGAPAQVDPYAAATSGQPQAPVVIFVYPFYEPIDLEGVGAASD